MSCTTAVFTLMAGAAGLGCLAIYYYLRNLLETQKQKVNSLNLALSTLQEERRSVIAKSGNMFLENATQSAEVERLSSEVQTLKSMISRMEHDNQLILQEYARLEDSIKVNRSYVSLSRNGELSNKDLALF
jgi:outer membrane murein-binding lipoprotein Lpp